MDAARFDTLARSLLPHSNRRGMLLGTASSLLAALPLALSRNEAAAKKKGKKKNKKKPAPPPPPPGPTCSDEIKNGARPTSTAVDRTARLARMAGSARPTPIAARPAVVTASAKATPANRARATASAAATTMGDATATAPTGVCFSDLTPISFENDCPVCPAGYGLPDVFRGLCLRSPLRGMTVRRRGDGHRRVLAASRRSPCQ